MARGSHPEKGTLRGLAGRRRQQKKADDTALPTLEHRNAAAERRRSRPVVHGENTHQQSDVAGAIHGEDAEPVLHRGRAKLKESDQQYRGNAHDLPSAGEKVERPGSECEQGSESEQVQ